MRSYVGNDIVDITSVEILNKFHDRRFLQRVFTPAEIACLDGCKRPDLVLWFLWSAKEAAYKALKKYDESAVFAHRQFKVQFEDSNPTELYQYKVATLLYHDIRFKITWASSQEWIHCNAVMENFEGGPFDVFDYKVMKTFDIMDRSHVFSNEESLSIYSEQSKAVRVLAKTLLYQNGLEHVQIIRRPSGKHFFPPKVYKYSKELKDWDISMSHDGSFVACLVTKT